MVQKKTSHQNDLYPKKQYQENKEQANEQRKSQTLYTIKLCNIEGNEI